jgi:N-acetylglucosaminyldiphosphoundecaprenol N-acetyl-beta-D-mannosaminyltransferase
MNTGLDTQTRPEVLGISIDPYSMAQAIAQCNAAIDEGRYLSIAVVNAAKAVAMRRDPLLREAVGDCHMTLADGQAVVWASKLLRQAVPERIAGIDLFLALLGEAARRRLRVYFLGARPDVLSRMLDEVARRFPGLVVAGARDGYFAESDESDIAAEISNSKAAMLFLGMSSPKKELFLQKWGPLTGVTVIHGVGGSFDILAGITRRAPLWYQKAGLEWLYRAQQEPLRLGRRYFTTNTIFIGMVGLQLLTGWFSTASKGIPQLPASEPAPPALALQQSAGDNE